MLGTVRTGVNNSDFTRAKQISICPPKGHWGRIRGQYTSKARLQFLDVTCEAGESLLELFF